MCKCARKGGREEGFRLRAGDLGKREREREREE